MTRALVFTREQLRAPFTLALLLVVPVLFVLAAADATNSPGTSTSSASVNGARSCSRAKVAVRVMRPRTFRRGVRRHG